MKDAPLHADDLTRFQSPPRARRWKQWLIAFGTYALLLVVSHIVQHRRWAPDAAAVPTTIHTTNGRSWIPLYYRDTRDSHDLSSTSDDDRPAVVLLHGTPGNGDSFSTMTKILADAGWRVIAPDLLGAGRTIDPVMHSVPSYAMHNSAYALRDVLDRANVDRAHIVGWSNGGGVALYLADFAPERVASITLMAAIAAQETEGSGDYAFECFKYGVGLAILGYLPDVIPHFGSLGTRTMRESALRPFWDSDQRPLRAIMESLGEKHIPAMILHGRHDFLIAARAAERHHEIMPKSTLVMLDSDHFMPFLAPKLASTELGAFFDAVESDRVTELPRVRDEAPARFALGSVQRWIETTLYPQYWPVQLVIFAALIFVSPWIGVSIGAMFAARGVVDMYVVMIAAMGAFALRSDNKQPTRPPDPLHWSRTRSIASKIARSVFAGIAVIFIASILNFIVQLNLVSPLQDLRGFNWLPGGVMVLGAMVAGFFGLLVPLIWTGAGRRRLVAMFRRLHHEYWPTPVFYIGPVVWLAWLSLKRKGIRTITCANPGMGDGGGIIGESKAGILRAISPHSHVLAWKLLPESTNVAKRTQTVMDWLDAPDSDFDGFPIVLKPDSGFRGYAVKVAKNEQDVAAYLGKMPRDVIVQQYHAGPKECAIMWVRGGVNLRDGNVGSVTGINLHELPTVIGNGRHTLEQLVLRHPRQRCMARVILTHLNGARNTIPAKGQDVCVCNIGNHSRGALFRDGSHLITPQLEDAIDAIARALPHPTPTDEHTDTFGAGGLDVGRFDIRYELDELLGQADGFGIVELNGTTSEPTHMYDPSRSLVWSWGVYFRHLRSLFDLALVRRNAGAHPAKLGVLYQGWRTHHTDKPSVS